MRASNISASHGWNWIAQALDVLKRHPVPFLVMGLIMAVIDIIPYLGNLVLLILGPALIAGTCYATQQADQGGNPEIGNLFRSFQDSERIGSMITLCIPVVVGLLIISILFGIFAFGVAMSAGAGLLEQAQSDPLLLFSAMGASVLILIPLVIIIVLVMYGLSFFAIPRTLLDRTEAFVSMKESLAACRSNFAAFVATLVILLVGVFVLSLVFDLLHLGTTGSLLVSTALYAVLGPTLYFGYREVFAGAAPADVDAQTTPPDVAVTSQPPVPPDAPHHHQRRRRRPEMQGSKTWIHA